MLSDSERIVHKSDCEVKKVIIAGGGTAGWIAAISLVTNFGNMVEVVLVESDDIGSVGVGESTIPPMRAFHRFAKIDEAEFMKATSATFKLGISFEDWGAVDSHYFHSFGENGKGSWLIDFHHYWLHGRKLGISSPLSDYCLELNAGREGKFHNDGNQNLNYAYHIDATAYAKFLRMKSEQRGAKRIEGKIVNTEMNKEDGTISALLLEDGQRIRGDFFIDCTGFRGEIIEKTLHAGYEDWSHLLLCDSAVAVQTPLSEAINPYTRAMAKKNGWMWNIPLRTRQGNGHVFCSALQSDKTALLDLEEVIGDEFLSEPRVIGFRPGRRRKVWSKNCLALGLASGFLEPLESTSIHMITSGIIRFMQLFPSRKFSPEIEDYYNRLSSEEFESVRDFLILHYKVTSRRDSEFWRLCADMEIPLSLAERIELYRNNAHAYQTGSEVFRVDSWVQVLSGQGVDAQGYHQAATKMSKQDLDQFLASIRGSVEAGVASMPDHRSFLSDYLGNSITGK